jgi:hypothetical protein
MLVAPRVLRGTRGGGGGVMERNATRLEAAWYELLWHPAGWVWSILWRTSVAIYLFTNYHCHRGECYATHIYCCHFLCLRPIVRKENGYR